MSGFAARMAAWILGAFACLPVAACDARALTTIGGTEIAAASTWVFDAGREYKLDVLVVVDTTPEGAELRQRIGAELPPALYLSGLPGGIPSLHLGVVFAGSGPSTCTDAPAAPARRCGLDAPYGYLATGPCGAYYARQTTTPDLVSCLVNPPTETCDRGDPLDVLARALEDPSAVGLSGPVPFFRSDATLVVVVASATVTAGVAVRPVDEIVRAIEARAARYRTIVIVATPPTSCGVNESVLPSLGGRLDEFAREWRPWIRTTSFCPGNFGTTFSGEFGFFDIGAFMCLRGVKDVDSETEGLQVDCVVEDLVPAALGSDPRSAPRRSVPSCAVGAPPCWQLGQEVSCGKIPGFSVVREPGFCPQQRAGTRVTCTVCTDATDPACAQGNGLGP